MTRINIGCGRTPTNGWQNFDNSLSIRLSNVPFLTDILHKLGFLENSQYQYIRFALANNTQYVDAAKGLPLQQESCDVVYSSQMLDYLDRDGADKFLQEAYRVLCPNGIIRIAVSDIKKQISQYRDSNDADAFPLGRSTLPSMDVRWQFIVQASTKAWLCRRRNNARW